MRSPRSWRASTGRIDAELEHSEQKFPGKLVEFQGEKVEQFSFTNEAQAREVERTLQDGSQGRAHGSVGGPQTAQAQSGAAVHHLHPAAGSRAQIGLQRAEDHARRAAALRRRRHRRGPGGPDHLHAHRLAQSGAGSHRPDPRCHRAAVRPGRPCRRAAHIQDQIEERAGSARGDSSDRGQRVAGRHREQARVGSVSAVFADLEAHRRLPDGAGDFRHRHGRNARRRRRPEAHRAARQWLDLGQARDTYRCTRKAWTTPSRTIRIMCCRP